MKPMIWSYFLQLSNHMWDPPCSPARSPYLRAYYPTENNDTDLETWDKMVDFIAERQFNMVVIDVGDGMKYESHPEISAPDAWDKDFLKKKLDELRAKGIEPIPKLNFSAGHCVWMKEYRFMISTPTYYKVCADLIAEVCEAFGNPRLFHLGLDEETANHQTRQAFALVRNEELWWHDCYFFFKECEKHGARPWVWSDYYWHLPDLFVKYMPKSVLQSNWYYHNFTGKLSEERQKYIQTYLDFDEMGYDQVPTASIWGNAFGHNEFETMGWCREKLNPDLLKGFMTVPWTFTQPEFEYYLKLDADMFYQARKWHYADSFEK